MATENNFLIKPFEQSGLFFEKSNEVHFYDQKWTILTHINTSYLNQRYVVIKNLESKISNICNESSISCNNIFTMISQKIPLIKDTYQNLLHITGKHFRYKRGWINFIGSGLKTLFGTLDSNDEEFYDNAINDIHVQQKQTLRILDDHCTVLSNTFKDLNMTLKHIKDLETNINSILEKIHTNSKNMILKLNSLQIDEQRMELLNYLNILTTETEIEINRLTNIVMFSKVGQIHPYVIPIHTLMEELTLSQKSLPSELIYPIPIKEENIHLLLDISEMVAYVDDESIIFVIKIPLTTKEKFEIYNMIPIPQQKDTETLMLKPLTKSLLISDSKSKAALIDELHDCKTVHLDKICKPITLFNPFTFRTCETELFLKNKIIKSCDFRIINQNLEIWHKIDKLNTWIYVLSESTLIDVKCSNQETIKLQGVGMFTITNKKCKAYSTNNILIPDLELTTNIDYKITEFDAFKHDCCIDNNLKYTLMLNPATHVDTINTNLFHLPELTQKVLESRNRISDILSKPNPTRHFNYIAYTTVIILFIISISFIYKCFKGTGRSQLVFKLCCFNGWFRRRESRPVVHFTNSERAHLAIQEASNAEVPYRFD